MKFSLALLLGVLVINACAQSLSIDWFTIAGGGTSTNGIYSVSGAIGQPAASVPMTNGNYSLTGGYWSIIAVQTEGAPSLSIARTSTNTVRISWSADATDWLLQQNTALTSTNWTTVSDGIIDDGTLKFIIVTPTTGSRFYRLFRP